MDARSARAVESRTRELGGALYGQMEAYHPSVGERLQDRLMLLLMEEQTLRTRLLRFVDVLAALDGDQSGRRTASLFREYFAADFRHLPGVTRLAMSLARSPLVPSTLLAWLTRHGTRLVASRFIVPPGPDCVSRALGRLEAGGRYPSLDLLGEAVLSNEEAHQYRGRYLELIAELGQHPAARRRTPGDSPCLEVSVKLSSLTAQFNPADPKGTLERVGPALEEICQAAREQGIGVTLDAEQYAYRELTWTVFQEVLAPGGSLGEWPDAGMVVQAYLVDSQQHARQVLDFAHRRGAPFRVRLVKGAYWDHEVIVGEAAGWPVSVLRNKGATDLAYERLIGVFLQDTPAVKLAVAGHNIRSHAYAEAVRESLGLPAGAVEHQTLYRTLEALSRSLARMDWVARDYVPVGELIPGMAYLVRRILENTSQVGFVTKTRLHQETAELLQPPQEGPESQAHRRLQHPTTGFENTPQSRLFDAQEREGFGQALTETRARWGSNYRLHLGAAEVETPQRVSSLSPSHPDHDHPVGWVHQAGLEETERAIDLANAAVPTWAARPLAERARIGLRAAELLLGRKEAAAAWVVHEGAKNWPGALDEMEEAIDHIAWAARELQRLEPQIEASYRPLGVVACIPPWNFPIALPAGMTAAALLTGNAVILKSAEATPIVAQTLVNVFHEAGVPKDVLVHLPGPGSTVGARLVESADVDMVAFTGSKKVGIGIYQTASRVALRKGGWKRVVAEMGGKNAIVVFPDADMDEAIMGILGSAFSHAGQKCSACSRVLVHREVYDHLRTRLVQAARSLPIGPADAPGTVINPVIGQEARGRIAAYAQVSRQEGRVLLDALEEEQGGAYCMGPLILELDPAQAKSARIAQEEVFGPILPLVSFDSEEEAISLVNSTVYALTLGVFSRSPRIVARMIRACRAGNVYVNRETTGARVGIEPFGGFDFSGTGPKTGSQEYLLAFLTRRDVTRDDVGTLEAAPTSAGETRPTPAVRPWQETPIAARLQCLYRAASHLLEEHPALEATIAAWKRSSPGDAAAAVRTQDVIARVLAAAPEIAEPQPTVAVPGQKSYLQWETARGIGIAAVDDGSDPATLAGLLYGPLLAGNGLVVSVTSGARGVAELLVKGLHRAGVPRDLLALAPAGTPLEAIAAGPVHFAAVDLAPSRVRTLYRALGVIDEKAGQQWLKALIAMNQGTRPGEPGFLRLFAHPKAVAIQTLRHGADLELL